MSIEIEETKKRLEILGRQLVGIVLPNHQPAQSQEYELDPPSQVQK